MNNYSLAAIIAFTILTLSACTSSSSPTSSSDKTQKVGDPDTSFAQESPKATSKVPTVYSVKDVVKINDRTLTVNSVKKTTGSGFYKSKLGKEFIQINLTIENTGEKEFSYNPFDFKLQDSNGIKDNNTFAGAQDELHSATLALNGKATGTLTFEKPINDPNLQLIYQPNMFIVDERIVVKISSSDTKSATPSATKK